LTHVWVMVDHKLPTQLQRSHFLPHTDFSISVCSPVRLHLLSKIFLSVISTQSQPFNETFIFNGKLHYCNNTY